MSFTSFAKKIVVFFIFVIFILIPFLTNQNFFPTVFQTFPSF